MSKKSKRKVDVKASILVLLLMAILLIASTYAWFTANKTVTISTLDVTVQAQNGLQISADGTNWKSILQNSDITTGYTGDKNQIPTTMEPVSTVGEINAVDGTMKMFYGSLLPDDTGIYKLTSTEQIDNHGTAGRYIAFDIFLKVDAPTNLNLSESSNVVFKAETADRGLQNSARTAFCIEGNLPVGSDVTAIQGLKGAQSFGAGDSTTYIWEPNADVHTAAAVANARDTYGITTTIGPNAPAVPYFGVNQAFTEGIDVAQTNGGDTTHFTAVTPNYITNKDIADTRIFSLEAGITKVRMYMWVEGQDVDCENTASGSDISFNVQFTVAD